MRLLLSRSRRHKKQYNINLYVLSIIGLCFGISVSSWRYNTFYANGASTTRRSSNKPSIMQCSSSSSAETDRTDADYYSERSSDSAKFSLSGSICGQNREYLLDNLNCRDDCEIQFCGENPKRCGLMSYLILEMVSHSLLTHIRSNIPSGSFKMDNSS